tara:strand:+ start:103200 stop:103544 length:345 start_codon:yes stop_codon:yes gene_type:complete
MDNRLIVGIGNIYACEALFSAAISPFIPSKYLTHSDIIRLHNAIISTLKSAIEAGGSSLKDHKQADGTLGYFQHNFKIYGKNGQICDTCCSTILRQKQGGRSTFFCPNCQTQTV